MQTAEGVRLIGERLYRFVVWSSKDDAFPSYPIQLKSVLDSNKYFEVEQAAEQENTLQENNFNLFPENYGKRDVRLQRKCRAHKA